MPATRATASTSPFVTSPPKIASSVSGRIRIHASARATRLDEPFAEISTIRASPAAFKCENCDTHALQRSPEPARIRANHLNPCNRPAKIAASHQCSLPVTDPKRGKIIVGMSGGVDSSVAALLLLEQGATVEGLFMKNWDEDDGTEYCTAQADFDDANVVANRLGIKLHA